MLDFIIKNAKIADGTGNKITTGCVAVVGDKIAAVEPDIPSDLAHSTIDANGLLLTPGFIDPHGHSDISILADPEAFGKISQGVTTEIIGNCGLSLFPINHNNRDHLQSLYSQYNQTVDWNDFSGYKEKIQSVEPAINIASLCGHNTLRAATLGYGDANPNISELDSMKQLLRTSLNQGAIGLSTGLIYVPGKFADRYELIELSKVVSETEFILTTHLRSEGDNLLEAIDEFFDIIKKTGIKKANISHLKTAGEKNWHKLDDLLMRISQLQDSGIKLTADRYPYIESATQLSAYMPSPYSEFDDVALMEHLQNDGSFFKFIDVLNDNYTHDDWERKRVIATNILENVDLPVQLTQLYLNAEFIGKDFIEISRILNIEPALICAHLLKYDSVGTVAASKGMSHDNMTTILSQPFVSCCTDESARGLDYSIGRSHPRGFGSFSQFFRLMVPILGIEECIRKITSLPADIFSLKQRGRISPGYYADLVLLDLDTIINSTNIANFANPHKLTEGIVNVWVNGKLSYDYYQQKITSRSGIIL